MNVRLLRFFEFGGHGQQFSGVFPGGTGGIGAAGHTHDFLDSPFFIQYIHLTDGTALVGTFVMYS